jgi:hypothetical protein
VTVTQYNEAAMNFLNGRRTGLEEGKEAGASINRGSKRTEGDASQTETALFLGMA